MASEESVHTMSVPVVPDIAQMFRSIDGNERINKDLPSSELSRHACKMRETMQLKLSQSMRDRLLNTSGQAHSTASFSPTAATDAVYTMRSKVCCASGQTRDVSVDERIRRYMKSCLHLLRLYCGDFILLCMPCTPCLPKRGSQMRLVQL